MVAQQHGARAPSMLAVHAPEGSSILFFLANRFSFEARAMVPWGCAFAVSHAELFQKNRPFYIRLLTVLYPPCYTLVTVRQKRKSSEPIPPAAAEYKNSDAFLYPLMPGSFAPSKVRKMHVDILRDRYIQVFAASMGNHSLSKFYCQWSQDQFEEALDEKFEKRLEQARSELADRASLIMMRGMGLVGEGGATVPPTVTAAMAKVVESMKNPDGTVGVPKKAYKLTVNGLARPAASEPVVARRGPGRPKREAPIGPMQDFKELP